MKFVVINRHFYVFCTKPFSPIALINIRVLHAHTGSDFFRMQTPQVPTPTSSVQPPTLPQSPQLCRTHMAIPSRSTGVRLLCTANPDYMYIHEGNTIHKQMEQIGFTLHVIQHRTVPTANSMQLRMAAFWWRPWPGFFLQMLAKFERRTPYVRENRKAPTPTP
jgi:hypothetical protein